MATRAPSDVRELDSHRQFFGMNGGSAPARDTAGDNCLKLSNCLSAAGTLLDRCRALGIELWADGERVDFDAPKGVLTPELKAELVEHKAALLAILAPPEPRPDDLSAWRWGPAVGDPEPGITIDRPDPERRQAAMLALADDPEAQAEREAIQAEPDAYAEAMAAHADLVETSPGVWSDPDFDVAWFDRGITLEQLRSLGAFPCGETPSSPTPRPPTNRPRRSRTAGTS